MSSLSDAMTLIRERCREFDDLGADFERLTEALLHELHFFNVRREGAGSQFGRDFTADLDDEAEGAPSHWYIECKNFGNEPIRPADIAPKLIWHLSNDHLTGGFVIVGPSRISNDLKEILERGAFPFSIYNWTAEAFAKVVMLCPETCQRWFPKLYADCPAVSHGWRRQLFEAATSGFMVKDPLRVNLVPRYDPPFQYAYFVRDGHFQKWNTGFQFVHHLLTFNMSKVTVVVRAIRVRTLNFEPLPERILVLNKAKGRIEPRRLRYTPSQTADGVIELLDRIFLRLEYRETELVVLELDEGTPPGLYEYRVELDFDAGGQSFNRILPPFRVCVLPQTVARRSRPFLQLQVWRRHYDMAARRILDLPTSEWTRALQAEREGATLSFGPSFFDEIHQRPPLWRIYNLPSRPAAGDPDLLEFVDMPEVVVDLGEIEGERAAPNPYTRNELQKALYGLTQKQYLSVLASEQAALDPTPPPSALDGKEERRRARNKEKRRRQLRR